ncbi:tape measure protein [Cytobacillus sp. Hm23]
MSGAQTTLTLEDRLTGPLTRMMRAMDKTISIMEKMDKATDNVNTKGLQRARSEIQSAAADLERLKSASGSAATNGIQRLQHQYTSLPGPIDSATASVKKFFAAFAGAAAAYLSIQGIIYGVQSFVSASDTYTSTSARLANINDGLQTQKELQEKIYQAAQRSRTGYVDLANSVAKLNLLAGEAFTGNDEAIKFGELMGKAFTVSGASTQEREAGMYQLTQAMAAGRLQGDEFRSIMENAPLLAKAIADATGESMGDLKDMSAEGTITADVIKSALFKAADDIEDKFKNMPLTFAQGWTMFKSWALQSFEPLFIRFSDFVNSDAFGVLAGQAMWMVNIFITGMNMFFDLLEWGYTELGAIGSLITDNWSEIAPYLAMAGAALFGYLGLMAALRVSTGLTALSQWALNTAIAFQGAVSMAAAGKTFLQTAAQHGLNAAMYAFPGTWILLLFVGAIGLAIYALYAWGDQTAAVIGFITGLFMTLVAEVYNRFAYLWNTLVSFAEFMVNLFIDPVYAVKKLFYDLGMNFLEVMYNMAVSVEDFGSHFVDIMFDAINFVLGGINGLIKAINKIAGVDVIPEVSLLEDGVLDKASNQIKGLMNALEQMKPVSTEDVVDFSGAKLDQMNLHDAYTIGNEAGQSFSRSMTDGIHSFVDKAKDLLGFGNPEDMENPFLDSPLGTDNLLEKVANPTGGKLDKVGKIDDEINVAEEDIKMLRELADIRSIQNFVTLRPQVSFNGDNIIREEADIDKMAEKTASIIEKKIEEDIARSTKGVYS